MKICLVPVLVKRDFSTERFGGNHSNDVLSNCIGSFYTFVDISSSSAVIGGNLLLIGHSGASNTTVSLNTALGTRANVACGTAANRLTRNRFGKMLQGKVVEEDT
jgi:hypothetical protein